MDYCFDLADVQQWAEFSGDYNPIHFSLDDARLAGMDELILHGMLALLPVKQEVSRSQKLRTDHSVSDLNVKGCDWSRFRALFRQPIPHGRRINIEQRGLDAGVNFKVCAQDTREEHFRGSLLGVESMHGDYRSHDFEFHTELLASEAEKFFQLYPAIQETWIALDAVVFASFMQSKLSILEDIAQVKMFELHGPKKRNKVVVQLSHTVSFDTRFFSNQNRDEIDWSGFSYAMALPSMVASEHQLAGTVLLPVVHADRLVMMIEIGLVAKFDQLN
ncbi:MaoC/PaaZ C-terminal domain-containing protein [Undibacterium cyanobacteriorum]|uniref:MaoC/PaaZ C-terminal domain-containing protein n=1 Tax=Undibacterium cyanobacteriorum TaxID=3073561 RepID=A0ABY9RL38_9BURK|nr:MaoC/PaaZ C-terminal domain-containing protein [Undibacterium sp. 20NA77.5]WMW81544.1 MaoC/PaaZ C-terminal domain-containing protein [Undibacterium sp. 20NA77.5]